MEHATAALQWHDEETQNESTPAPMVHLVLVDEYLAPAPEPLRAGDILLRVLNWLVRKFDSYPPGWAGSRAAHLR
jgi:hypothetical protein